VSSRRYLLKNARSTKGQAKNDIIILIPAYREAEIVADTLRYYSEVAGVCNIRVIFVTTEVEGDTTTNKTYLTLKKLIGKEPNILLEHYPKTHGSKGSQLNMVMDKYQSQTDYFAIFDIDSRPDIRGIQYVQQATTKTDVYQMPSVYLPHPSNTLASQTMSVFQSRWSYCFEIPKWRQWQANPGKSQVMYTVGHGLFIRNDVRFSEKTIA
jgi:cellulose synthase/poly-beta-1,6-N-acetylglucosamine synthase-like glycosyltransferase